ncbi:MAG: UvrD-helicase domain-containing protein, partial [Methanocellales archaeon]|nr:UvrD-helicase domain-containing protein [Methanocellales archaeon]
MVNKILGLPGTGKTTRLMDYIEEWKREYGLENVCAETFRVEMARELRSRVLDEGVENEDLYWFGTTHGICRRIQEIDLKDIAQEAERKEFCEELGIPYKGGKEPEEIFEPEPEDTLGDQLFSVKTWLTLNLKEPTDWRQAPSAPAVDDEVVISFMEQWEEYKEKKGIYDFDDMLKMEHEDPRSHPPVDGLAVDEFQDKAKIQYEIYAKWKKYIPNVVIAGDPHQCLYDYFGASPEFFFAEEGDLEILGTTWRLLEDNWSYAKATLERVGYDVPELRCRGEGGFVRSIRPNEYPSTVLKLKNESTFHLVRCNYMVREIASTLISLGVPFYTRKGFGGWTKSQVNLYNGILKLRKMRKHLSIFPIFQKIDVPPLSSLEFKAIVDSFPKKSFTKE